LEKKNIMVNQRPKTWDDVVAAFQEELFRKNRSQETISAYTSTLKQFGIFYQEQLKKTGPYVLRLQETDLYAFIDYLRSTRYRALSSVNRAVATLHVFCHFIVEMRWHKRNIAKDLKTYRVGQRPEPKQLSSKEIRQLITSVNLNGRNGYRDLAILQLFLQCGLRVGEVSRLSVRDAEIHKTAGRLKVHDEKTRSERTMPLNASARSALQTYLDNRGEVSGSDPLFLSERNKRISTKTVQYLIKRYLCAIGRSDLSVHDLRHHFAMKFYNRVGKLTALQQVLGHRSITTTARYTQCTEKEIADAMEGLSDNVYPNDSQQEKIDQ
jgi:integrase/recombinase XerC